jgi:hypothetical protein
MRVGVASTSRDAYHDMGPRLGDQQRAIVAFLAHNAHRDYTRNEIAQATGMRLSAVCGRVAELLQLQMVHESPRRPDRHTGVNAHPVKLAGGQLELGFAA